MLPIREPEAWEIRDVVRAVKNGEELDDRETWIYREYLPWTGCSLPI